MSVWSASLPWAPHEEAWEELTPALPDAAAWRKAEAACGPALAEAVAAFTRLDERVRLHPQRLAAQRLAIFEAADLAAVEGSLVPIERVILDQVARLCDAERDAQAMNRIQWAVRRLSSETTTDFADPEALREFLNRRVVSARPGSAEEFEAFLPSGSEAALEDWRTWMAGFSDLHPFTQAAASFQNWRALQVSGADSALEGGAVAARIAAMGAKRLRFAPLALGDRYALNSLSGLAPQARLKRWLAILAAASRQGLARLDRLLEWRERAGETAAANAGPALDALVGYPAVSAPLLAMRLGVSNRTARRTLNELEQLMLIEEMTGHGRFRYWRALA